MTKNLRLLTLFLTAVLTMYGGVLLGQTTTTTPYLGVTKIDSVVTTPREDDIHVLEINLTAPGIHFEMSPGTLNANLPVQKTLTYMGSVGAQFAINTEFFVNPNSGTTPLWGFAASDGTVYSPFQTTNGNTYAIAPNAPAINIDASNNASVVTVNPSDSTGLTVAQSVSLYNDVAGSAQIITNGAVTIPGYTDNSSGPLIDGSGYSSSNSWYDNGHLAARSAIGLSQDDKTLYLFTVDDNTANGSLGMTVTEEASYLQGLGVYNALNLDGGGSTTLSWENPANQTNSDINLTSNVAGNTLYNGTNDRLVGASLAIFASPVPEPGTIVLLCVGAGAGLCFFAARRKKSARSSENNERSNLQQRTQVMTRFQHLAGAVLAVILVFAAASFVAASTLPFSTNFSTDPTTVFTSATNGSPAATWSYSNSNAANFPDTYEVALTRGSGSDYTYSSVPITNFSNAANSSFTVSALLENMTNSVPNSINTTVGLRFLADTTNSNTNAFVVDLNIGNATNGTLNTGAIRAVKWSGGSATVYPNSVQSGQPHIPGFVMSDPYLLQVFGNYNALGQLDLQVEATDQNPADAADSLPLTDLTGYITPPSTVGTNFGLFMSTSGNGTPSNYTTNFGSFAVAAVVPEPSTLVLLGVGAMVLLACARRRRK